MFVSKCHDAIGACLAVTAVRMLYQPRLTCT